MGKSPKPPKMHKVTINWKDHPEIRVAPSVIHCQAVTFEGGFVLLLFGDQRVEAYPAQDIKSVFVND